MRTTTYALLLAIGAVVGNAAPALAQTTTVADRMVVCSCGFVHSGACPHGIRVVEPGESPLANANGEPRVSEFRISDRWARTATDGLTGTRGTPVTLTWGIVDDRTNINFGSVFNQPSELVTFLDENVGAPSDRFVSDIQQKSWFSIVESAYTRWGEISGLTFVYEPNDDGRTVPFSSGVLGVRPDLRLAGASVDGQTGTNTLAFNAFPDNGDGVIDTDNTIFYRNPTNNFRALRNVLAHEIGHALGFNHLESSNSRQLLEPFIDTSFDGPQIDDILAAQRNYGDAWEKGSGNNSIRNATQTDPLELFGVWGIGLDGDISSPFTLVRPDQVDFISIDDRVDVDFFEFTAESDGLIDFRLKPVGPTYNEGPEGGAQSAFDASAQSRLTLTVFNSLGQQVAIQTVANAGETVNVSDIAVVAGESYYARVGTVDQNIQLYRLDAALNLAPNEGTVFELDDLANNPSGGFTSTQDGVELTLTATGARGLLAFEEDGIGITSNLDTGQPADERDGIDGSLPTPEELLITFDQTVILDNLSLAALSTDGSESVVLSLLSGPNPFDELTGYAGPYTLTDTSISLTSPNWQSEFVNFAFGVGGQSPLVIQAGTILSLTSRNPVDGGFLLRSLTATAVPEPAGWLLAALGSVAASRRRRRWLTVDRGLCDNAA